MPSEWTIDTLKEYVERILEERQIALGAALASADKAVLSAFQASKEAITKAETAQNAHNEIANNWRGTLSDLNKTFMPKSEAESETKQLRELIERNNIAIVELQKSESRGEGGNRAQMNQRNLMLSIVGLAVAIFIPATGGIITLIFYLLTKP